MPNLYSATDYLKHKIYDPIIHLRNFDHDLPDALPIVKRTALIALPFLSMYKPIGLTLSVGMGGARVVTHLTGLGKAIYQRKVLTAFSHLNQTALAVISLAATLFNFQIGLLVTSLADAGTSIGKSIAYIRAGEAPKAIEELAQASSSLLYASFMVTGTLEAMLASILFQGALSLYHAAEDLKKKNYPEAVAKIALGAIRLQQAYGYVQMIQRRDVLLKYEKLAALFEKIQKGRDSSHLTDSSLLLEKDRVVMVDANGKEYNFGTHYHGTGKGLVKGMNLQFRTTVVDGQNMKNIDFKVNHAFRDKIESLVKGMESLNAQEIRDLLTLTNSHVEGISIKEVPFQLCEETSLSMGQAYEVTLTGLGKVFIGSSSDMPGIYDTVRVQIDENKSIHDLHEMLTFFNLDDALRESSVEDIERLKIGQLFRMFYPVQATTIERKDIFFHLPVEELKEELIKQVPEMKETMALYLDKMQTTEILPGRLRYALPNISKMAYDLGARSLISTITGNVTAEEKCNRLVSILKMGMNSAELRYQNGMIVGGLSSEADFETGGADSVFTQLLTKNDFDSKMNLNQLNYFGNIRILFALEALDSGTYQYLTDEFGTRKVTGWWSMSYLSRLNILDFVKGAMEYFRSGNEVMIKERIDSSLIKGIIVSSNYLKSQLLSKLRYNGLVSQIDGIEKIFDVPVHKFIHVTNNLTDELLA